MCWTEEETVSEGLELVRRVLGCRDIVESRRLNVLMVNGCQRRDNNGNPFFKRS
jgi:hypothetical protein